MVQLGGASTFIQIPTLEPREEGKYPTHGTRSKFYLVMEAKNILIVFSAFSRGFLKHSFVFNYKTATHFKIGFKTWGLNSSIFVLYKLLKIERRQYYNYK